MDRKIAKPPGDHGAATWAQIGGGVIAIGVGVLGLAVLVHSGESPISHQGWFRTGVAVIAVGTGIVLASAASATQSWRRSRAANAEPTAPPTHRERFDWSPSASVVVDRDLGDRHVGLGVRWPDSYTTYDEWRVDTRLVADQLSCEVDDGMQKWASPPVGKIPHARSFEVLFPRDFDTLLVWPIPDGRYRVTWTFDGQRIARLALTVRRGQIVRKRRPFTSFSWF